MFHGDSMIKPIFPACQKLSFVSTHVFSTYYLEVCNLEGRVLHLYMCSTVNRAHLFSFWLIVSRLHDRVANVTSNMFETDLEIVSWQKKIYTAGMIESIISSTSSLKGSVC